jgi:beta-aspartyl-dipeptidase (metallo-type)
MFTLIENGDVYGPGAMGQTSVLLAGNKICRVGEVDARVLEQLQLPLEVIDAKGCVVTPGLVDPHQHLLGGSGEEGFSSQTPEISAGEIVSAGITTVVGCLGVDTTMKTMAGLLGRAKALKEEGLSAHIWSGGYNLPPTTITFQNRKRSAFAELGAAHRLQRDRTGSAAARFKHHAGKGKSRCRGDAQHGLLSRAGP